MSCRTSDLWKLAIGAFSVPAAAASSALHRDPNFLGALLYLSLLVGVKCGFFLVVLMVPRDKGGQTWTTT